MVRHGSGGHYSGSIGHSSGKGHASGGHSKGTHTSNGSHAKGTPTHSKGAADVGKTYTDSRGKKWRMVAHSKGGRKTVSKAFAQTRISIRRAGGLSPDPGQFGSGTELRNIKYIDVQGKITTPPRQDLLRLLGKRAEEKETAFFKRKKEIEKIRTFEIAAKPIGIGRDKFGRVTVTSRGLEFLKGEKISSDIIRKITTKKIKPQEVRVARFLTVKEQIKRFGGMIIDTRKLIELEFPEGHPKAGQKVIIKANEPLIRNLEAKIKKEAKTKKITTPTPSQEKKAVESTSIIQKIIQSITKPLVPFVAAKIDIRTVDTSREKEVSQFLSDLDKISKGKAPEIYKNIEPKELSIKKYIQIGARYNNQQLKNKTTTEQARIVKNELLRFPKNVIIGMIKTSVVTANTEKLNNLINRFRKKERISPKDLALLIASNGINVNPQMQLKILTSKDEDIKQFRNVLTIAGIAALMGISIGAAMSIAPLITTGALIGASPFVISNIVKNFARNAAKRGIIDAATREILELGVFAGTAGAASKRFRVSRRTKTKAELDRLKATGTSKINKLPKGQKEFIKPQFIKGLKKLEKRIEVKPKIKEKITKLARKRIKVRLKLQDRLKEEIKDINKEIKKIIIDIKKLPARIRAESLKKLNRLKLQLRTIQRRLARKIRQKTLEALERRIKAIGRRVKTLKETVSKRLKVAKIKIKALPKKIIERERLRILRLKKSIEIYERSIRKAPRKTAIKIKVLIRRIKTELLILSRRTLIKNLTQKILNSIKIRIRNLERLIIKIKSRLSLREIKRRKLAEIERRIIELNREIKGVKVPPRKPTRKEIQLRRKRRAKALRKRKRIKKARINKIRIRIED